MAFAKTMGNQIPRLPLRPNLKLRNAQTGCNPQNLLLKASQALANVAGNIRGNPLPATSAGPAPARQIQAGGTNHPGQAATDQGVLGLDKLGIEGLDIPATGGLR